MSKSYTLTPPRRQAQALFWGGMLALAAAELGGVTYAMQTASQAQTLDLGGGVIVQTDVVLKAAMQIAAGLCLAIGPAVAAYQWRGSARNKTKRAFAWVAIAASLIGFVVATTNLSGYMAHTRGQHVAEAAASGPLYDLAVANAARAAAGLAYLSSRDRELLEAAQAPATARRSFGDIAKAALMLALISAMGSGFSVAAAVKKPKRQRKPRARGAGENVEALDLHRKRG